MPDWVIFLTKFLTNSPIFGNIIPNSVHLFQVCAAAAGGAVSVRDFVNLRQVATALLNGDLHFEKRFSLPDIGKSSKTGFTSLAAGASNTRPCLNNPAKSGARTGPEVG